MKKKFLLCLAVSTATAFAQNDSAAWFHPLHVGNEWIYRTSDSQTSVPNPPITTIGIIQRTVERDTVIDNTVWSIVRNKNVKTGASNAVRERYDTLTSRFFSDDDIIDSVLCIQSGILFGSWKTVHNVYADTLLSKPTISRHLKWLLTGLSREWVFSYGLGMTREDKADGDILGGSGSRSEIAYARINGMEFGTKNILMADSLSQYHPLQTGNRWIYKTTSYNPPSEPTISYVSREVTGDTIIGTTLYKRMTERNSAGVITGKSAERFDDITGNYIVHTVSGPTIEDSAAASVVNSHFGVYGMRKLAALYTDSLFGVLRPTREIRMANHIAENDRGWKYAYGIGLTGHYVKELDPSPFTIYSVELVYAKIDGMEYGVDIHRRTIDSLLGYYPLHAGNKWVYTTDSAHIFESEEIVGDTLLHNGKWYAIRLLSRNDGIINTHTGLFFDRIDTTTCRVYRFIDGAEQLMDSLFMRTGDSLRSGPIIWCYVSDSVQNFFGKAWSSRTIKTQIPPFETNITSAGGIGVVKKTINFFMDEYPFSLISSSHKNIIYAAIDGTEYGINPLSVDEEKTWIPAQFSLMQNFPNPFNPVTTIAYSLPERQCVVLRVFDMLGRTAATLVNEPQTAGLHSVQFDGSALASGLYFYQLQAGNFIATKKMLLLK